MAELLTQKLAQLEAIASNARESIENAKAELESSLSPRFSVEIQTKTDKAKSELESTLSEQAEQAKEALETKAQELERAITQALQEIKSTFRAEFSQALQSQLANIASNFTKTASQSLQEKLAPQVLSQLTQSGEIKSRIAQAATDKAEEFISELDLQSLINYARFDTKKLAKELARLESSKAAIKEAYEAAATTHIASLDEGTILKALKHNATRIYRKAMAADELLKDRYEMKLRLLAQSIETTQEQLERQLRHSSRLYALEKRPPISEKENFNNILVAR